MRAHFLINSVKCLVQKSVSNRTVFCAVANYQPYFKHFSTNHIAMVQAKKFIYAKRYEGEPKVTDFKFVEEDLPPLKDGGKHKFFVIVIRIRINTFCSQKSWWKPNI